jgi:hypothetical protein
MIMILKRHDHPTSNDPYIMLNGCGGGNRLSKRGRAAKIALSGSGETRAPFIRFCNASSSGALCFSRTVSWRAAVTVPSFTLQLE